MTKTDLISVIANHIQDWMNNNNKSMKDLSELSGVNYEVIRRLVSEEVLPRAWNCTKILETINLNVGAIYEILRQPPYSKDYLPENAGELKTDPILARDYAQNNDKVILYGLTNKLNGTNEEEIKHELGKTGIDNIKDILENRHAGTINNRIKRDEISFHDKETNIRFAVGMANNALKNVCSDRTRATTFAIGLNEKGLKEWSEVEAKIQNILNEFHLRRDLRGDTVLFESFLSHTMVDCDEVK